MTMKQYTKPTATVVELSVKENIAALPVALKSQDVSTINYGSNQVILTTYNLATASTSNVVS